MNNSNFIKNTQSLVKLAYPILITQLIQTLMNFFDTVMAGRVSATDMAAVAIASSIWLPIILGISGITMALAVIVSQYSGKKQSEKIANATFQTAIITCIIGISLIVLFYSLIPISEPYINIEASLKNLIIDYLLYIVWGAPAFFLFLVLRNFAEGLSLTKPTMFISMLGLLINIPLNYLFIYGAFNIEGLGGAGCGIATAIVYWMMFCSMLLYVIKAKKLKKIPLFDKLYKPDLPEIKHILKVGVPIALSLLFEVSLFSVVAIILAPFGAETVASHQIAINFSGLIFMIPLSFAMAVTIKVGFAIGEKQFDKAKEICRHSIIFSLILALITSSATLLFKEQVIGIYTEDIDVIHLAASLMFLAALFQFSDAIQVLSAGALRGYKDTTSILIITFIAYWLIGLGLGVVLGITDIIVPAMGPAGFWIGFIVGLTIAAVLLTYRLKIVQKRFQQFSVQ
jgi:MATE family multidrug resistance protein